MPHRILTLSEVADFLHLSKREVESLVQQKEIPFERRADRLIFPRQKIEAWASERLLGLQGQRLDDLHRTASAKAHDLSAGHAIVPELMQAGYVDAALEAKTKASVLRQMVGLADETGLLYQRNELLDSLVERERLCSTALAGGMALLHPQHHEPYMVEDSFVVLGRTVQPIPFGSPDGATTDLFFLVCCQEDRIHLHVLARLCMLCYHTSLLLNLREAGDGPAMYATLVAAEKEVIRGM